MEVVFPFEHYGKIKKDPIRLFEAKIHETYYGF